MLEYQRQFIEFALQHNIIRFGEFTLKSGRISPYFFDAGLFYTGETLKKLGEYFAQAIVTAKLEFDILFGPAYKGITLASTTAIALTQYQLNVPFSFNRKEIKDHGEGGQIVGAQLEGKILIIDDVITAGTAFREVWQLINASPATITGVIIALDRQEKGQADMSSIQEIEQRFNIPVISIVQLQHLLSYMLETQHPQLAALLDYRDKYGIAI